MAPQSHVIALARAFLAGEQHLDGIVARGAAVLGKRPRWLAPLARRYLQRFAGGVRPRQREVERFLAGDAPWATDQPHVPGKRVQPPVKCWTVEPLRMQPVATAGAWPVRPIETVGALAEWLGLSVDELAWFADLKALGRKQSTPRLQHYRYTLVEKRHGGVRLIEAPKARLKAVQRLILAEMLERVPQYYTAAHGFVKGRSVSTFAQPHTAQRAVLRMDLQQFFPSICGARVQALFRTMGYPEPVADVLGGLCTNATPRHVFQGRGTPTLSERVLSDAAALYGRPHLPQGAPTSPALANMCAYHLDCRLTGLADWAGALYTRYADDLAFSGGDDFARHVARYATEIAAIVMAEGWSVEHHKTRIMRCGVRQQLAGLVVNERLNVPRAAFDALKATLTNCARRGVAGENRDAHPDLRSHLAGRVAWIASINAAKGKRLREIFETIAW